MFILVIVINDVLDFLKIELGMLEVDVIEFDFDVMLNDFIMLLDINVSVNSMCLVYKSKNMELVVVISDIMKLC